MSQQTTGAGLRIHCDCELCWAEANKRRAAEGVISEEEEPKVELEVKE